MEEKISPENSGKGNEILQKIWSPGIEGKMYNLGLVLGFCEEKLCFLPENIGGRFLPAIGCL